MSLKLFMNELDGEDVKGHGNIILMKVFPECVMKINCSQHKD